MRDNSQLQSTLLFDAIAFAARAHRHQSRKDGVTPYVSHAFRVAMVACRLFGVQDEEVLAACALHDTIEDTPTDYDDLSGLFGPDVASWVACLTKDMRLPEEEREHRYREQLTTAPWQVVIGKLADIFDNLLDSRHLALEQRRRNLERSGAYLEVLAGNLNEKTEVAFRIVQLKYQAFLYELDKN